MDNREISSNSDKLLIQNLQQGIIVTEKSKWAVDVNRVDKLGVNLEIKKYKNTNGSVNFLALRDIPAENRIIALARQDFGQAVKLIAVALTLSLESMNLTRPMTPAQVVDLAEVLVEESESDNLSIPDLLIFLQRLTRGHYPGLYEGIDATKFLERFSQYRDERWAEFIRLRDEKIEEYKRLGDDNHHQRYNPKDTSGFGEMMQQYRTKAQVKRDERRERKNYDN